MYILLCSFALGQNVWKCNIIMRPLFFIGKSRSMHQYSHPLKRNKSIAVSVCDNLLYLHISYVTTFSTWRYQRTGTLLRGKYCRVWWDTAPARRLIRAYYICRSWASKENLFCCSLCSGYQKYYDRKSVKTTDPHVHVGWHCLFRNKVPFRWHICICWPLHSDVVPNVSIYRRPEHQLECSQYLWYWVRENSTFPYCLFLKTWIHPYQFIQYH